MPSQKTARAVRVKARDLEPLFREMFTSGALQDTLDSDGVLVDLFAGGGGATSGLKAGLGRSVSIAVNHNANAISVHERNSPETRHYHSDVFEVDPLEATQGRPVTVLWASPDCRSWSPAKGGAPIQRNLRALPWAVPRWMAATSPRFVVMENVMAISTNWGPLIAKRKDGKVITDKAGRILYTPDTRPKRKNRHWKRFIATIERLGYQVQWTELCAADYGAPTTRRRLFLVASRDHEPFVWPAQTHAPADDPRVLSGELLPWVGVHTVLDYSLETRPIFDPTRSVPIAANTLRRLAIGAYRYVLDTDTPFIVPQGPASPDTQAHTLLVNTHDNAPVPLTRPSPTITTQNNRLQLLTAHGVTYHKNHPGRDVREPIATITAGGQPQRPSTGNPFGLAVHSWVGADRQPSAAFISKFYSDSKAGKNGHCLPVTTPAATITTVDHHGLAQVELGRTLNLAALSTFYGGQQGEGRGTTLRQPMPTQTTSNRHALMNAACIIRQFGTSTANPATSPLGTIVTGGSGGKSGLMVAALGDPLAGLSDEDRHRAQQVHDLILREVPEARRYSLDGKAMGRVIGDNLCVIKDISLRMLVPDELKKATGFSPDYVLHEDAHGKPLSRDLQVKLIGNSVPPPFAEAIGRQLAVLLAAPAVPRPLPEWLQARRGMLPQAAD